MIGFPIAYTQAHGSGGPPIEFDSETKALSSVTSPGGDYLATIDSYAVMIEESIAAQLHWSVAANEGNVDVDQGHCIALSQGRLHLGGYGHCCGRM